MLTTSHIQAPAGLFCDASSGRRTGISARGYVRCPILDPVQDFPGERPHALPGLLSLVGILPPTNFPRLGFGRARASIISQRDPSAKIVRASQHINLSRSLLMLEVKQKEIPQCGTIVPSSRSTAPSAR